MCVQRLLEYRRRGAVAVGQTGRQTEQEQLPGGQRLGSERRRLRGPGNVGHVCGGGQSGGVDRRQQRLQVGLARELGVERPEPLRGAQQQWRSVATASQVKGNLSPHALHLGSTEFLERTGVRDREQRLRGLEVARGELRLGGRERARCTAAGSGVSDTAMPEERRRGGDATTGVRAARARSIRQPRPGPGARRVRSMPGSPIGIEVPIGRDRERGVSGSSILPRSRRDRPPSHERMAEPHPRSDLE